MSSFAERERPRQDAAMNGVLWPDAEVQSVTADYDTVVLRVRESTGAIRVVRCEGYIGYSLCGFWDEVVVSSAAIVDEHESIDRCVGSLVARLGADWGESGNAARNAKTWKVLRVLLSDGAVIEVVAARFAAE